MPSACLNCGESFGELGERRRRADDGRILQQFGGAYFAAEGALWRSLKLLLLRPGELTAQYLAGRRKQYVLPLRLYLTLSVFVLVLVRVAGSGPVEVKVGDAAEIAQVFALHVHAFWFVALLFTLPGWGLPTTLALLGVPVYTLLAMKRVYGGRLWPRLLRAGLVSALYGTTLVLALAGVALVSLLS